MTLDPIPVIDDEARLHQVILAELDTATATARNAVSAEDLETAIHDVRKALRRTRAIVDLVYESVPKAERRTMINALREARRALASARDQAVAHHVVEHLELDERAREAARVVIATATASAPIATEVRQALAEGAARAAAQVDTLRGLLPTTLEVSSVVEGAREIYRAARRARAKHSKRAFHRWRRRTKELSYQLQLLESYAGAEVGELRHMIEDASDAQGPVVDLIMLRDLARKQRERVDGDAIDPLLDTLDRLLEPMMKDIRRAGRSAFRHKPRTFADVLAKAIRADLAAR